jgi:NTE family protein
MIGGTRLGALVGGFAALDNSFDEMMAALHEAFHKSPVDLNWLPYMSLVKGKKIDSSLKKVFGEIELADTWLNMYCVASNISRANMHVFQKGLLRQALRASIALPGVFAPVLWEGDFLIDGGIFDNLPVETMVNDYKPHKIIAVEVGFVEKPKFNHDLLPSNFALWRDSFRKEEKRKYRVPTVLSSIVESMMLCSDYKTSQFREKVDLMFRPDLTQFGAGDLKKYKELVQAGYEHAVKALESQTSIVLPV